MTRDLEGYLAWSTVRIDAVESFNGQTPRPEDESIIIDVFEVQPQLVQRAIEEVATAHAAGKITWAWSALRARLERGAQALRDSAVDVGSERTRRVAAAERWLENAGVHYDRQEHVEAELFGDEFGTRGILGDYRDDEALVERMLTRWHELRPRGERAELEAEAYMRRCAQERKQRDDDLRELKRKTLEELAHMHE